MQIVEFAHNLTAPEQEQDVFWNLLHYSPVELLAVPPTLIVDKTSEGKLVGKLSVTPASYQRGAVVPLSLFVAV